MWGEPISAPELWVVCQSRSLPARLTPLAALKPNLIELGIWGGARGGVLKEIVK